MSECRCTGEPCSNDCPGEPMPCPECCDWMRSKIRQIDEEITLAHAHNHTVQEVSELLKQEKPVLFFNQKSKEKLAKWLDELVAHRKACEEYLIATAGVR